MDAVLGLLLGTAGIGEPFTWRISVRFHLLQARPLFQVVAHQKTSSGREVIPPCQWGAGIGKPVPASDFGLVDSLPLTSSYFMKRRTFLGITARLGVVVVHWPVAAQ